MNDDTMAYMMPYLTLLETVDFSRTNRRFNLIVHHRVGLREPEILILYRIIHGWYRIRRRIPPRINSWLRISHDPDERIILTG